MLCNDLVTVTCYSTTMTSMTYRSYLLRVWRENKDAPWRGSLKSTADGQEYHFSTIEALWSFLQGALDKDTGPSGSGGGPEVDKTSPDS